jgi:hypothetical protein
MGDFNPQQAWKFQQGHVWKDRYTKLHDPNNTSSPTADLDAEIALCYANPQDLLAADRQLAAL